MKTKFILILALFSLIGCGTPPYQKAGANGLHRTGYEEFKIQKNVYRLKYSDAGSEVAHKRFLRRASELAAAEKKQFFCLDNSKGSQEQIALATGLFLTQNVGLDIVEGVVRLSDKEIKDKYCFNASEVLNNTSKG